MGEAEEVVADEVVDSSIGILESVTSSMQRKGWNWEC